MFRSAAVRPVTSRPEMITCPDVGCSNPAMILSVVDFPQPDGPSKEVKLPSSMESDTSFSATTEPKWRVMFLSSIMRIEEVQTCGIFLP